LRKTENPKNIRNRVVILPRYIAALEDAESKQGACPAFLMSLARNYLGEGSGTLGATISDRVSNSHPL
jgi:hypothetical protein